ncbi:MAG TPA: hypothetical protein VEX37_10635 [Thermomicrobiales bacterium]|nr:hypothetical protein [Thermomicrobiales bacterium]
MTTGTFTEQDTQTFATKLEAFSQTLTTGEQAVLTMIEQHLGTLVTTSTDDDVQGYMMDLGAVATIRQREMLHEADRFRAGARAEGEQVSDAAEDRAGFWQRIAIALGNQATAMAPRATGQPATG